MLDILFTRTFLIVGCMLLVTTITSRINKSYETIQEFWLTFIGTFAFLFLIMFQKDNFPFNLINVAIFSGLIGWSVGPSIEYIGRSFKMQKFLKSQGIKLKKDEELSPQLEKKFERSFNKSQYHKEWRNVIFQTFLATTLAVFATIGIVFLTSLDFSFLSSFLFISLLILIIVGLLNIFYFRSALFRLVQAYFGAILFTLYLLYDFGRLKKNIGDESWGTAIDLAVNIYLDIINLFLDFLEIFSHHSN